MSGWSFFIHFAWQSFLSFTRNTYDLMIFFNSGGYTHVCACSVVSDSLHPTDYNLPGSVCLWDFPGKDTGVDFHFLLQGIFPTQGLNLGLLCCRHILHRLSYQGLILACYSFNLKNFLIESLKYVHRQSYVTP